MDYMYEELHVQYPLTIEVHPDPYSLPTVSNVKSSDEWKVYLYLWALLRRANGMHPLARAQALSFVLMLQACMSFSHKILCMQHSSKLPSILTSRYMGRMAWGNLQWAVIPGGIPGMH